MKKRIYIVTLSCLLLGACQHRPSNNNNNDPNSHVEPEYSENFEPNKWDENLDSEQNTVLEKCPVELKATGFKSHEFRDARTGLVVSSTEYPSNWNVISKPVYTQDQKIPLFLMQIQGPNRLRSFNIPIRFHIAYPNPQIAQLMHKGSLASMIRPMIGNEQIIKEEVHGRMSKTGYSYVGIKNIPKVKSYIRETMNRKGASHAQLDYLATEWKNSSGQRALVTLVKIAMPQSILDDEVMIGWFYSLDYVFVDENKFENTIEQLAEATLKTKENAKWNQYVMLLQQQRAQIAAQKHRIHMYNRQAAFDAHQQKMKGIWVAQDANHTSFMNTTLRTGSNSPQRQFLNMINEEEIVYNPSTGKNYQVQAGSLEYWMDSDGHYIKNNDLFYGPNGDINLNNREWIKVQGSY